MGIEKYLARHAVPDAREVALLREAPGGPFEHCVVIPACDEPPSLRDGLVGLGPQTLCIVVVNGPDDSRVVEANRRLLDALRAPGPGPTIWAIDRIQGHRHGVGGARRLGTDLALALAQRGALHGRFVHWLDADCSVDTSYFDCEREAQPGDAAIVHPFTHVAGDADAGTVDAHRRYELSLRHYVLGLHSAGSPYAHHSIGSTIAVDIGAYAAVRGVPLREAGEDFHMLDKLRQQGPIVRARTGLVSISMRRSTRVPFGTGPAVERLREGETAAFYDWRCFAGLGEARATLLARSAGASAEPSQPVARAMVSLGLDRLVARLQPGKATVRARAVDVHLSGLKSLRLIHALRDGGWPTTGFEHARTPLFEPSLHAEAALARLEELERTLPPRAAGLGAC